MLRTLVRPANVALAVTAFWSLGCLFGLLGGGRQAPEANTCNRPTPGASITQLEIGLGEAFVPLEDGDPAPYSVGGQGLDMVEVRLGIDPDGPDCLEQGIEVRHDGELLITFDRPLETSRSTPFRITDPIPLLISSAVLDGSTIVIEARALGLTDRVEVVMPDYDYGGDTPTGSTGSTGETGDSGP